MKKIVLLFAAVVLLASCVKENTLAPEQTGDNLVTIKALAMDTKTTLGETTDDQTAVLWEGNDKIMVVYENVDGDNNNDDIITEFAINSTPEGSSATFKGQYNSTGFPAASQTRPFAVYPSSSVTDNGQGKYTIKHNLPDVQDGKDLSGRLLSTAILKDEDLMAGTASATFKNALTLLYITVPEGVTSVALTASYGIVGDATFTISNTYSSDSVWDEEEEDYVSTFTEATGKLTGLGNKKTVTLSNEGNALEAGTYPVLIYPGYTSTFTVTMTGTSDDVKFEKTLADLTFTAGEFRNLNLTQIFQMEVKETETVSPMGAKLTIPVAATKQETYYVEENADWISVETSTYVQTKAFTGTNIVLNIEANTTGDSRTADVTITWGTDGEKTFTISQESAYLDFVYVDPADPESGLIQWEESFGIFDDAALNSPVNIGTDEKPKYLTYEDNKFTIEINTENPEKGTYIVKNIFKNAQFHSNGNHSAIGGEYYAKYEGGKLTILKSDANRASYVFVNDVVLTYDSSSKTFVSDAIALGHTPGGPYNQNNKYIGNYEAHHYVAEDPGTGDEENTDPIAGTWTLTAGEKGDMMGSNLTSIVGETMHISGSDGNYVIEMIAGYSYNLSVQLDGNTLSGTKNSGSLSFTYDTQSKTLTQDANIFQTWDTPVLKGIVATKQGGAVETDITGTYGETGKYGSGSYLSSPFSGTFSIAKNDDAKGEYVISGMFDIYSCGMGGTYYADFADGVLTIKSANSSHSAGVGSLPSDISMTYSDGVFTMAEATCIGNAYVGDYTATKQ